MDTRSGTFYSSLDAARAAGVPDSALAPMDQAPDVDGRYVVASGPFKGRVYDRNTLGQLVRNREAERRRKAVR